MMCAACEKVQGWHPSLVKAAALCASEGNQTPVSADGDMVISPREGLSGLSLPRLAAISWWPVAFDALAPVLRVHRRLLSLS